MRGVRHGDRRGVELKEHQVGLLMRTVLVLGFSVAGAACAFGGSPPPRVREPAVAGRFYPAEAGMLRRAVEAFLRDARTPGDAAPVGLIVPHAGYIFSGQIAADAWRQAAGREIDVVVLLGTNHTDPALSTISVFAGDGYRTPLGVAAVDRDVVRALLESADLFVDRAASHEQEHSLEVQVPFVQVVLPRARIVPLVVGRADPALCRRAGESLARALAGKKALVVASSDLSHYPSYEDAGEVDRATLAAAAGLDPERFREAAAHGVGEGRGGLHTAACGEAPVTVLLEAMRRMGGTRGAVLSYANSGDAALGEHDRVVGYGAIAVTGGGGVPDLRALARPVPSNDTPLTADERRYLVTLARETIRRYLETGTTPLVRDVSPALLRPQGAFVTLRRNGELRGCIGHIPADTPVAQAVSAMALQAAFGDRRFEPLAPGELDEIDLDVSLLTAMEPVPGPDAVVLGRDGVHLRKEGRSALFLPEVATEQGWNREQLFDHLCQKAGLPAGSWKEGAEIHTFRSEVIHERPASP